MKNAGIKSNVKYREMCDVIPGGERAVVSTRIGKQPPPTFLSLP